MFHPNVDTRTAYKMHQFSTWYFQILKNTGVLSRLGKNIVDGKIVNLHQLNMKKHMNFRDIIDIENQVYINSHLEGFFSKK
jgi:hypothetical protein